MRGPAPCPSLRRFVPVLLAALALGLGPSPSAAAQHRTPYRPDDPTLPAWAKEMYSAQPNVFSIDRQYREYFREHAFEKTAHTQYYKWWRREVEGHVDAEGFVHWPSPAERRLDDQRYFALVGSGGPNAPGGSPWRFVGPDETYSEAGSGVHQPVSWQVNVYCIARSASDGDVLYCGTEGGGLYKTTDHGLHWFPVTDVGLRVYGVTAVEVHPTDPNVVFFGSGTDLYRSTDGGATWTSVLSYGMTVNDIAIHPTDPTNVWAATSAGLFHSTDGGASFVREQVRAVFDLEFRPNDPDTMYLVRDNPTKKIPQFFRSTDKGVTWKLKKAGWYSSSDPVRYDGGARLAVTPAAPRRVYAILIGESKAGDDGFVGVYRSDDAGRNWTLPNGQVGGPYDDVHPNLMTISPYGGYQQGYYDLALGASATNADEVLVGGTSLWRSTDGAASWSRVGGYGGPVGWIHPDIQDLQVFADEAWLTTDGGVNVSTDLFRTHEARNRGISASDFWGFGAGEDQDSLVGGRYHNGDTAFFETYPAGRFLRLGGAESATGYVNPGLERRTFHSDLGGKLLPRDITQSVQNFSVTKFPNESYFVADSSKFLWHPHCWNIAWLGRDHELWRTEDQGATWTSVHTFGTVPTEHLTDLEVSASDPNVLYVVQQTAERTVWKSLDGGQNFVPVTPPSQLTHQNNRRNMVISLNPEDDRDLWLALAGGPDGYKVFRTQNGGLTWTNETTATFDGQSPTAILAQAGTQGGVLLGTDGAVFYRTDASGDWQLHGSGFPPNAAPVRMFVNYPQAVLRAGCYRRAIWESDLCTPSRPVAQVMVEKLSAAVLEDLQFRNGSTMDERGAVSFAWQFPGGTPATSTERNPVVRYGAPGSYDVTLSVTDAQGLSDDVTVTGLVTIQ